ncbi:MAG: glycosyltransferase [Patescibacteria group bacterium]|jgi:glycosyltransferase involved in cell wall biosynthesis
MRHKNLKVALVHDYLSEYGGAERVLETLCKMFPEAPIYTAFAVKGSSAWQHFKARTIIESRLAPILKWKKLYSPLRFLAPWIWEGFDFSGYDVVISSASWYITKGIIVPTHTKHICYCHTPPRFLYGYPTAVEWQRYLPIRVYATLVNTFLRRYDFAAAQRVDQFVVNSENVRNRVRKFYKKDALVVYPPIAVEAIKKAAKGVKKQNYYLIVSRVVGAKGIDMAMAAVNKLKLPLKIAGETAGLRWEEKKLQKLRGSTIEFLGRVSDEELWKLYAGAKAFLALAEDEDFGMTVVEAQAAGTPVVAYWGGGYKETIVESKTGEFFKEYSVESLIKAIEKQAEKMYARNVLIGQAEKFSERIFMKKVGQLLED